MMDEATAALDTVARRALVTVQLGHWSPWQVWQVP